MCPPPEISHTASPSLCKSADVVGLLRKVIFITGLHADKERLDTHTRTHMATEVAVKWNAGD